MKLFVDDWRPAPDGWTLARSAGEAIRMLVHFPVSEVSLDHDICHYIKGECCQEPHMFLCQDDFRSVAWFISRMPPDQRPKKIIIHTGNPWGAIEIEKILRLEGMQITRTPSPLNSITSPDPEELHRYKQDIRWKAVLEMQKEKGKP